MTCGTQRKKEERVTVDGKFLCSSAKAIKLGTVFGDEWFAKSLISDWSDDLDDMRAGDEVAIEIPRWLAREKGWVE